MSSEIGHVDHRGHIVYSPHFTNEATKQNRTRSSVSELSLFHFTTINVLF